MIDSIKRFEVIILRPLHILLIVSAIAFLFQGMWFWLVACVFGSFYLGIIGSSLHPLQSATDLSKGPLETPTARLESDLLPQEVKEMLVGQACTKVGLLLGAVLGALVWGFLGWHWYFALIIAFLVTLFAGAFLKITFKAAH
jgi:MFS family permease